MTRKLIFAAFLLTVVLTVVAAHHQLTNAAPNIAPPPRHAPPIELTADHFSSLLSSSASADAESLWTVVAGERGSYKDYALSDVSMTSPDNGWIVGHEYYPGSYGMLLHYTGTTWSRVEAPTGTYSIFAVKMISSTEGWAAGNVACSWGQCDQGLLMHYTAASGWQRVTLPTRPDGNYWSEFYDIDIKDDVGWIIGGNFEVGASGIYTNYLLQFNGTNWMPLTIPLSTTIGYISVADANETWASGGGKLAHFSGGSWSVVTPTMPANSFVRSIHMLSASDGWGVGYSRTGTNPYSFHCLTIHYDGSNWSQVTCPAEDVVLDSVYMRTPTDGWAVGSTVAHLNSSTTPSGATGPALLHYDGSGWSVASAPSGVGGLSSVTLVGAEDGWAVGGNQILHLVNGNWTTTESTASSAIGVGPLDAVANDEVWWGGSGGILYQWKNGTIITRTSPVTRSITALSMYSSTLGWASTYDSNSRTGNIVKYSDGEWSVTTILSNVTSISMVSPNEGWFATRKSTNSGGFLHYKDGIWIGQSVPGNYGVSSVSMISSTRGWAAGGGYDYSTAWSRVYTYTGTAWRIATPSPVITGDHGNLKVIGISPDEAWVVGYAISCTTTSCPASPQLHHFSGGTWTSISMPDWLAFYDISKVSATEWWAAGKLTNMEYASLHYKDGVYTTLSDALGGISMLPDGAGFASGPGCLLWLSPYSAAATPSSSSVVVYTDTLGLTTTVSVPAGAVTETTSLRFTPVFSVTGSPNGLYFAGRAFQLLAYRNDVPLSGFVFSVPVTIAIHYSDGDVAGLNENSLDLRYWTGSAWASDGISVVERNAAQNYVVFTITHLSQFALFGQVSLLTPPSSVAITGPTTGTINTTYTFTATVSPVTATTPITYVWQATGQSPVTRTQDLTDTATFTWPSGTSGVKAITVTAMNEANAVTGIYGIAIYAPPQAAFTAAPTSGVAPMQVVFTNTSSGDYTSSWWEFGDGMTSALPSPTHTYLIAGVYGVTLTVSAPGGSVIIPGGTALLPAVSDTLARANYITVTVTQAAGVSLAPNQNGTVLSGQSIVYQHTLTNTGAGADSFTMTASIDRPGWSVMAAPSVVGPLGPGIASSVVVTVTAPSGITTTVVATARITATSKFDANVTSAVMDVTAAQAAGVSLTSNQNGRVYPGQSIVYQHTLTNTGTGADSFTMTASIDRPGWSVIAASSVVGPLGPGIASSVVITVTAPSGITTTVVATARITATSQFDANVVSIVQDVTTGQPYRVYLPVVIRQ